VAKEQYQSDGDNGYRQHCEEYPAKGSWAGAVERRRNRCRDPTDHNGCTEDRSEDRPHSLLVTVVAIPLQPPHVSLPAKQGQQQIDDPPVTQAAEREEFHERRLRLPQVEPVSPDDPEEVRQEKRYEIALAALRYRARSVRPCDRRGKNLRWWQQPTRWRGNARWCWRHSRGHRHPRWWRRHPRRSWNPGRRRSWRSWPGRRRIRHARWRRVCHSITPPHAAPHRLPSPRAGHSRRNGVRRISADLVPRTSELPAPEDSRGGSSLRPFMSLPAEWPHLASESDLVRSLEPRAWCPTAAA